jgi:hypothetical protein
MVLVLISSEAGISITSVEAAPTFSFVSFQVPTRPGPPDTRWLTL